MATQEGTQNPIYLTITTGIGIAGDLSSDLLKSALEDASFETKLAALVPGAQLWVVKNIGNSIEIGLGLANGDINQVGKAVIDLLAETAIGGATDAAITGFVTGVTGGNIEIAEPIGIGMGILAGLGTSLFGVGDSLWSDIVNSSGKNAILNLGLTQIEFSLTSAPQILSSGGTVSTSSTTPQVTQAVPQDSLTGLLANNDQSTSSVSSTAADGSTVTTTYAGNSAEVTTSKGFQETLTYSSDGSTLTSDTWKNAIGTNGTDTYATDGSSKSTVTYADGNYATTLDDGQGNITTDYYTKGGVEIRSTWVHSDGTSGVVSLYNDGLTAAPGGGMPESSLITIQNPDGSYSTTGVNSDDQFTDIAFSSGGTQTSESVGSGLGQNVLTPTPAEPAGSGVSSMTIDNGAGVEVGTSWRLSSGVGGKGMEFALEAGWGPNATAQQSDESAWGSYLGNPEVYAAAGYDYTTASGAEIFYATSEADGTNYQTTTFAQGITYSHLNASGTLLSDQWAIGDPSSEYLDGFGDPAINATLAGTDSFNADGSGTGTFQNLLNGTSGTITLNGQGDIVVVNANASGVVTSEDVWNGSTGTYQISTLNPNGTTLNAYQYLANGNVIVTDYAPDGTTVADQETVGQGLVVNPDGSDFSKVMNADGSYTIYYQDSSGDTTAWQYSSSGQLTGSYHTNSDDLPGASWSGTLSDGTNWTSTSNGYTPTYTDANGTTWTLYVNAAGQETGADWVNAAAGTHGYVTLNADKSQYDVNYNADGSFNTVSNDGQGDITQEIFDAGGNETGNSWTAADGSIATTSYNADGSYSITNDDGKGDITQSNYTSVGVETSDTWTKADGSSGSDTYNPDGTVNGIIINGENNILTAGSGNDIMYINGSGSIDTVYGGSGTDTMVSYNDAMGWPAGTNTSETFVGGSGLDIMDVEENGNATFVGGSGGAVMIGPRAWFPDVSGAENPAENIYTYISGSGDDMMFAGPGSNIFEFSLGGGQDTIVSESDGNFVQNGNSPSFGNSYSDYSYIPLHAQNNGVIQFGSGIGLSNISLEASGNDLIIHYSANDSVKLRNWFSTQQAPAQKIDFADGSSISMSDLLKELPLTVDKSSWTSTETWYSNVAFGFNFRALDSYEKNGMLLPSSVTTETSGNTTINANGSSSGTIHNSDGSYDQFTNDGAGDVKTLYYSSSGVLTSDLWTATDGSYGGDYYFTNGVMQGSVSYNADGTIVSTDSYNSSGTLTQATWSNFVDGSDGSTTYNADGSYSTSATTTTGNTSTDNYTATGVLLSDTWTNTNGSSGNDTFNADGSSSGKTTNADGSTSTYTNDGKGDVTTDDYNAAGTLTQVTQTTASDTKTVTSYNSDGSYAKTATDTAGDMTTDTYTATGVITNDVWKAASGASGTETNTSTSALSQLTWSNLGGISGSANYDASTGSYDILATGPSGTTYTESIQFSQSGADLVATIAGNNGALTAQGWGQATNQTSFIGSDGQLLGGIYVEQLVQAMAGFTPPTSVQSSYMTQEAAALSPIIAASWQ